MNNDLLLLGSAALKRAALHEDAKHFIFQNETLYALLKKAADRYIGGETLEEAIPVMQRLNADGYVVTTDFMGESIRSEKEAIEATDELINLA